MESRTGCAFRTTGGREPGARRNALPEPGVAQDRICMAHGLAGNRRDRSGVERALACCREGDTPVVSKPERPSRPAPDARDVVGELERKGEIHARGAAVREAPDPMGRAFIDVVVTFSVSRSTVWRTLRRGKILWRASSPPESAPGKDRWPRMARPSTPWNRFRTLDRVYRKEDGVASCRRRQPGSRPCRAVRRSRSQASSRQFRRNRRDNRAFRRVLQWALLTCTCEW